MRRYFTPPFPVGGNPIKYWARRILSIPSIARASSSGRFPTYKRPPVAAAMDGIEKILRAQYLVGFSPTGKGAVKYRRISLELAGRARSVRVRAGYRGTEPPVQTAASTRVKSKRNERKKSR